MSLKDTEDSHEFGLHGEGTGNLFQSSILLHLKMCNRKVSKSEAWICLQGGIAGHREFRLEDISWIRETTTSQSQGQKTKAWKILRNKGLC